MSRTRHWLFGGFAAAVLFVSPVVAQDAVEPASEQVVEVDLSPKFVMGEEKQYVASVQFTRTDEMMDGSTPDEQKRAIQESALELNVTRRVSAVNEHDAVVELVFTRLKIISRDPMKALEFDSTQPVEQDATNPLAAAVRPMVNATVTLLVGNDGMIKSIQRPSALVGSQASGQMVAQIMGDEPIRELFGPLFAPKPPPAKIAAGTTWTRVDFVPIGSNRKAGINIRRTDTLSSWSQGQAVIDVKGVLSMKKDPDATQKMPELMDSKLEGTIVWDLEAGRLRDYDVTQMIRVEGDRDGTKISTRNESMTSVRLVD